MKFSQDNFVETILPKLKDRATRIRNGGVAEDLDDLVLQIKFWFSSFYKIPMKSAILDEYSLEDLFFEYFLHNPSEIVEEQPQEIKEVISEARDELADFFAAEEDASEKKRKYSIGDALSKDEEQFMDKVFPKKTDSSWQMTEEDFKENGKQ